MRIAMSINGAAVKLLFLCRTTFNSRGRDTPIRLAGLAGVMLTAGQIYQHADDTLLYYVIH